MNLALCFQVILKEVWQESSKLPSKSAASLERLAALLPKVDTSCGEGIWMITKKSDVIKALDIWSNCFESLALEFQAETGECSPINWNTQ